MSSNYFISANPNYIKLGNVVYLYICKRKPRGGDNEEPVITYIKRENLSSLTGFDVGVKLSRYVLKDIICPSGFMLPEKNVRNRIIVLLEILKAYDNLNVREYTD